MHHVQRIVVPLLILQTLLSMVKWEAFITASRTSFQVPKKGQKPSDLEKANVIGWCNEMLVNDAYRRALADPYGNPAFVAAVGFVFNNIRFQGGHATSPPKVSMQQLALISLKVRLVLIIHK